MEPGTLRVQTDAAGREPSQTGCIALDLNKD